MTKAIFLKEWLKTRRVFWVSLLVAVLFAVYAIMCIRRVSTSHGVEHVWLIMLMKDQTFIDAIKYVPALIGIALGVAQMAPEMQQKRLKLTLHLPFPQNRLIATMIGTGLGQLLVIFLLQALIIGIYYRGVVTSEMTWHVMLTTIPGIWPASTLISSRLPHVWRAAGGGGLFSVCSVWVSSPSTSCSRPRRPTTGCSSAL